MLATTAAMVAADAAASETMCIQADAHNHFEQRRPTNRIIQGS